MYSAGMSILANATSARREPRQTWIVSACLLGTRCRYDGAAAASSAQRALRIIDQHELIPFCPEVAGGLPTPRIPAHLNAGDGAAVLEGRARVVAADGTDVTRAFIDGAELALGEATRRRATHACLKARSPSCGVGAVHGPAGLFPGDGVTAARLRQAGLQVVSDEDLPSMQGDSDQQA